MMKIDPSVQAAYNNLNFVEKALVKLVSFFYQFVTKDYNKAFTILVAKFTVIQASDQPAAKKADEVFKNRFNDQGVSVFPAGSSAYQYQKCLRAFGKVEGNIRSLIQASINTQAKGTDVIIKLIQDDQFTPAEFVEMVQILKRESDKLRAIDLIESDTDIINFIKEVIFDKRAVLQAPLKKRILEADDPGKALLNELTQAQIINNEIKMIPMEDLKILRVLKKLLKDENFEDDRFEALIDRLNRGDVYVWLQISTIPESYNGSEVKQIVLDEIFNRPLSGSFEEDVKILSNIRNRIIKFPDTHEAFIKLLTYLMSMSPYNKSEKGLRVLDSLGLTNEISSYYVNIEILKLKKALLFNLEKEKVDWSLFKPEYKVADLVALWPNFSPTQQQEYRTKLGNLEQMQEETDRQLLLKIEPFTQQQKQLNEELYQQNKMKRPYDILSEIALIPDSMLKIKLAEFFHRRFLQDNLVQQAGLLRIDAEKFFIPIN